MEGEACLYRGTGRFIWLNVGEQIHRAHLAERHDLPRIPVVLDYLEPQFDWKIERWTLGSKGFCVTGRIIRNDFEHRVPHNRSIWAL